ncbi:MAG: DUF502 domain-containing protein [bacterium]|nr:DUF502 domain-containing protein [bacterium]
MDRLKKFTKTTVLGGILVLLPVFLTALLLNWIFTVIVDLIRPLTKLLAERAQWNLIFANLLVVAVIIAVCFLVGLFLKTKVGHFLHDVVEKRILKIVPFYNLFRNTVKQFLGQRKSPFSRVAMVQPYENKTMMTAFITDEYPNGWSTVFVPSALNPTTGFIFHLENQYVHPVDVSVEDAMRSIISCGAGSCKLMAAMHNKECLDGEKGTLHCMD